MNVAAADVIAFPRAHAPLRSSARPADAATGATLLAIWADRRRQRRGLRALLRQPDAVLADFGLTRAEAEHEAAKPFWRG